MYVLMSSMILNNWFRWIAGAEQGSSYHPNLRWASPLSDIDICVTSPQRVDET